MRDSIIKHCTGTNTESKEVNAGISGEGLRLHTYH